VDLHKHLESYISSSLIENDDCYDAANSYVEYTANIGYEYSIREAYTSITNNSGFAQINFASDPGFEVGDNITIYNSEITAYNTEAEILNDGGSIYITNLAFTSESTTGSVRLTSDAPKHFLNLESTSGLAFNGVVNWLDFTDYTSDTYNFLTSPSTAKFLTSMDFNTESYANLSSLNFTDNNTYHLRQNSKMYLNFFDSNQSLNLVQVGKYNSSKTFISDKDSDNALADIITVAVGPYNVNNSTNIGGFGGTPNFLVGASYYYVFAQTDENSCAYKFKIVDECSRFEDYQFLFLDRFGSYLPLHFNLLSRKNVNINKSNYNSNWGEYNPSTNSWGYNKNDVIIKRLNTEVTEQITVNSDWQTENMSNMINEMYASPIVYHIDENNVMRAINILTTSYTVKTKLNDKLINHTFTFEYTNKNNQQR
jgi:hypothetical protein